MTHLRSESFVSDFLLANLKWLFLFSKSSFSSWERSTFNRNYYFSRFLRVLRVMCFSSVTSFWPRSTFLAPSSAAQKSPNLHCFYTKMACRFQKKIWKIVEKCLTWSSSAWNGLFRKFWGLIFKKWVKFGATSALSDKNHRKTLL